MKIAIITNGGIGDLIQYSSLIFGLKEKYRFCEITLFCDSRLKFIYRYFPYITVTESLTDEKFDLGFNFALRTDLCTIFDRISITQKVGFVLADSMGKIKCTNKQSEELYEVAIRHQVSDKSLSEWFCYIAEVQWQKPKFYFKESFSSFVSDIIIQYGTSQEEKNWSYNEYYKLICYCNSKKYEVCITGHIKYKDEIITLSNSSNVDYFIGDNESLNETAQLISNAKLLITPDTSVAHIGLGVDTRTIVLSGNYDRGFAYTSKQKNLILIKENSMSDIKFEKVMEKMIEIEC
jgi:ADP-heptose:LPS heptosyltransferase